MAVLEGIVQNVRMGQEGDAEVLRFVLQLDGGQRVPVEMSGQKVHGFLTDGDRVQLDTDVRDSDGVVHPVRITDLTTSSSVHADSATPWSKMLARVPGLVTSIIVSVITGVAVKLLTEAVTSLTTSRATNISVPVTPPPLISLSLILGLLAGLVVFALLYIRPRLRR